MHLVGYNNIFNPYTAVTSLGVKLFHALNTTINNNRYILNALRKQSDIYVRGGTNLGSNVKKNKSI
jgi:hypothetical protein